jgi:multidrug efflux system outer membrane protein
VAHRLPDGAEVANTKWWEQFGDPVLNDLVESALRENRDVRIAAARVDQFIGALTSRPARSCTRRSATAPTPAGRAPAVWASRRCRPAPIPYFSLYQASLGASWQLDLFGRVRRLSEAAQAQVYASEQAQRGVVLSLVTSVATSYIVLRALDRQLEIAQATARNFGATARLFDLRFKAGIVAKTEVMQITVAAPAGAGRDSGDRAGDRGAGEPHLDPARPQPGADPARQDHRPARRAADPRRPALDAAATPARHPAGRAEPRCHERQRRRDARTLLPDRLDHRPARQRQHGVQQRLYRPGERMVCSPPASAGPIFTFGGIEGQVSSAEAQNEQALLFYQQTILNAFRETNDALTGSQKKIEEVALQSKRVEALREFARLSKLRFDKGVAAYLDVLVAENELFAAELAAGAPACRSLHATGQCVPGDGRWLGRHRGGHGADAAEHDGRASAVASGRRLRDWRADSGTVETSLKPTFVQRKNIDPRSA